MTRRIHASHPAAVLNRYGASVGPTFPENRTSQFESGSFDRLAYLIIDADIDLTQFSNLQYQCHTGNTALMTNQQSLLSDQQSPQMDCPGSTPN